MSGQQIGTVVGGAIGAYFGGPAGAQLGMAIGGTIGGIVDPTHINGPKIGDGQQQSATDGNPIAWVQGTAMIAGTIVQVSPRRQVRHKDNGKGGPVQVTYTAVQDFAILVCESSELRDSTMSAVLMVFQDGKLVYDIRAGSPMLAASQKWKANVDFMFGAESQLPHPTLEAITGVGNTPAYRGSLVAVFKNFDVSAAGDRVPSFQFVVGSAATWSTEDNVLPDLNVSFPHSFVGYPHLPDELIGWKEVYTLPAPVAYEYVISGMPRWAFSATSVDFVYGTTTPHTATYLDPAAAKLEAGAMGGRGWWSDWRYYYDPPLNALTFERAYFASNGLTFPADMPVGAYPVPSYFSKPPALSLTVTQLQIFHGFDASTNQLDMTFADTTGLSLSPLGGGYYQDLTDILKIWRVSWVPPYGSTQVTPNTTTLGGIIDRVAKRGGLGAGDYAIDADVAATLVAGYPIARQSTAAECLTPLLQAYFSFGTEYDSKLRFKFYGSDAGVTVDRSDLIEGNEANPIVSNLRNQATEFPKRIVASYMDPAQNYSVVDVSAERLGIDVIAIGDQSLQIPVVMAASDAAQAAQKALKVTYATLEGTQEYSTPFAGTATYLSLAAGEPLQFQGKRYVADEMILSNGAIKFTARYDRQSAYTSNVQATSGNAPLPTSLPYSGPTLLVPMNLPPLRPQDGFGMYLAANGASSSSGLWPGATVQVSLDGQVSWQSVMDVSQAATLGRLTEDEVVTGAGSLRVFVDGDLESVTAAQIAAQANAAAILDASGVAEVLQFMTATEESGAHYLITNLTRGLDSTPSPLRLAGEQFVMLDSVYFYPIDTSFAGSTIYFRAVTQGTIAENALIVAAVYVPDLNIVIDGGAP